MKKVTNSILVFFIAFSSFLYGQNAWTQLRDFPGVGRFSPFGFQVGGRCFMGLGYDTIGQPRTEWYEYLPATGTWVQKNNFPGDGTWFGVSFVIKDKGYISTGCTHYGATNHTWQYDPNLDHWTQMRTMPGDSRENAVCFVIDTFAYVGTGFLGLTRVVRDFWKFDPHNNTWTAVDSLPGPSRKAGIGFAINGKGYAGLGIDIADTYQTDFYEFDPSTGRWSSKTHFPGLMANNPFCFAGDSSGYMLSGMHYSNIPSGTGYGVSQFYQYTAATDSWSVQDSFSGPGRGWLCGFTLGDTIFCGAGSTSGGDLSQEKHDFWMRSIKLKSGIGEAELHKPKIYPNPFGEILSVTDTEDKIMLNLKVYDMEGRLVAENMHMTRGGHLDYNLSHLNKGEYIMQAYDVSGKLLWKDKIVKQ